MEQLTFHCKVVTPMFLGNALGGAELRPTAIKAALRFWWRALQGNMDIKQLHERESAIFGSAGDAGRSKIVLTVSGGQAITSDPFHPNPRINRKINKSPIQHGPERGMVRPRDISQPILEYLAFGAVNIGQYRPYIKPEEKFDVVCRLSSDISHVEKTELEKAFFLSSVFGGLGSKSRNGFGKFEIIEPLVANNPKEVLASSFARGSFTSLSKELMLLALPNTCNNWNDCLAELGKIYLAARVNYHNTANLTSGGLEKEHDWSLRPFIGSPVIIDKQTRFPKLNGNSLPNIERHAKTHFIGIQKLGEKYQGYILHLPYQYLVNSNEKFGLSDSDITALQAGYNIACQKFNNNLQALGMKKVEL